MRCTDCKQNLKVRYSVKLRNLTGSLRKDGATKIVARHTVKTRTRCPTCLDKLYDS